MLGWLVWKLAKRRLRQKLNAEGEAPGGRRVLRTVGAVAALAALAAAWSKRSGGTGEHPE